jgi:hypothetical protein
MVSFGMARHGSVWSGLDSYYPMFGQAR